MRMQPVSPGKLAAFAATAILLPVLAGFVEAPRRQAVSTAAPRFDAISIRPFATPSGPFSMGYHADPTYWSWTATTLEGLACQAYLADTWTCFYRLKLEGPGWVATARFDVQARASAPPTGIQFRTMLQNALRERFHLVVETETHPIPAYRLEARPGEVKLKPATDTSKCGRVLMRPGRIAAACLTLDDLADALGNAIQRRPVFNRTGLPKDQGYMIELDFGAGKAPDAGPSIFTAVRQQLGLRLAPASEPVEVHVIKSADKPSPN